MYNSGKGKMVAVSELVKIRNKERNAMLSALKRKKGKGKSGPNILDDFNQEGENQGDLKKGLLYAKYAIGIVIVMEYIKLENVKDNMIQ